MSFGLSMPDFQVFAVPNGWSADLQTGIPFPAAFTGDPTLYGDGTFRPMGFGGGSLAYIYQKAREWTITTPRSTNTVVMDNIFTTGPNPWPNANAFALNQQSFAFPLLFRTQTESGDMAGFEILLAVGLNPYVNGPVIASDGAGLYYPSISFEETWEDDEGFSETATINAAPPLETIGTFTMKDLSGNVIGACTIRSGGSGVDPTYGDVTAHVTAER